MRTLLLVAMVTLGALLGAAKEEGSGEADDRTPEERIKELENTMGILSRQIMMQQLYMEEKNRGDGDSGVKQLRVNKIGTRSYHSNSHTLNAMLAIHDHSNNIRTVGLGEFSAVLNGVEFRTRHNDFPLRMPHRTSKDWGAVEEIPFPAVPPQVLQKKFVTEQIKEMQRWFKAFRDQRAQPRDFRKYFRPVLCYLEGMWTTGTEDVDEPFESDRHAIDAATWFDLTEKIRFTAYSGRKSNGENFSYLPTKIIELVNGTVPVLAQWNYRITCAPLKAHLPLSRIKLSNDLSARLAFKRTMEEHKKTRGARFELEARSGGKGDKFYSMGLLDEIMGQIPGRDNYPAELVDTAFGEAAVPTDTKFGENKTLNAGYYHRFYKLMAKDAMGLSQMNRGFSDRNVFMAMTTNPKVAPMKVTSCKGKGKAKVCTDYVQRWSYAIPLEIIYLTPLNAWNPYNVTYWGLVGDKASSAVTKNGRNGGVTKEKAWNGTNSKLYYRTPDAFFGGSEVGKDPADTAKGAAGVLDPNGKLCIVRATGTRVFLPEIPGVGILRTRYPIAAVHAEGSVIYKELEATKDVLMKQQTFSYLMDELPSNVTGGDNRDKMYDMEMGYAQRPSQHTHYITISSDDFVEAMRTGNSLTMETTQEAGHTHTIKFRFDGASAKWQITECDGQAECFDGHVLVLTLV